MIKVKEIWDAVKAAPRDFPVETAIGTTFSVAMMLVVEDVMKHFYPLIFMFVIFVAAITLRKIHRGAYYASFLLVPVAFALFYDTEVIGKPWFWVLNIVAAIVLIADVTKSDNKNFANTVISRVGQVSSAVLLSTILSAMVSAIIGSVMYLFSTDFFHLIAHVNILIFYLVMPLVYCSFQAHGDEGDSEGNRLIRVIVDFIMSPALAIYTFVLVLYILKIIVEQELPRGGMAYMVSIYIGLVLVGNLLNKLVRDSHFNWFYDNFAYIAVAPIVLLWIGTIYRINEYGLTEWRVYLLIVNVLMTVFPLMLKIPRLARYNLMTVILMTAMVLFTCIPPVSARSIGVRNQYSRFLKHAREIGVFDDATWTLRNDVDITKIEQDSTLNAKYWMMKDEYNFLRNHCDTIRDRYSSWAFWNSVAKSRQADNQPKGHYFHLKDHVVEVPLDGFNTRFIGSKNVELKDGVLTVVRSGTKILEYNIQDSLKSAGTSFYDNPLSTFKYHNDSVLIVIYEVWGWDKDGYFEIQDCYQDNVDVYAK